MDNVRKGEGDCNWFHESRFGMFIHWGLYASHARGVWAMWKENIPVEEYEMKYFRHFDPDLYDPALWAKTARKAGMKYFVITTKHHEGFCLWDSRLTDYKATRAPAGRDLLKPMIEAFRKEGLRVGLYHSLYDWHHPAYIKDVTKHEMPEYVKYLHGQVKELLTQFGEIDILWMDLSFRRPDGTGKTRDDWKSEKLYRLIRKLQPRILLNDRLDLKEEWDIKTPEQFLPREWIKIKGKPVVWESCQTLSGQGKVIDSWGYNRNESLWRDTDELIRALVGCVSRGGNLLLNVGPSARGEFDKMAVERLEGIGEWMKRHNRSIYGCTQAPAEFATPENCRLTYNPKTKRLYVHIFAWPYKHIYLDGKIYEDKVEYARLLNDGSEIGVLKGAHGSDSPRLNLPKKEGMHLSLPLCKPDVKVPVIELFLK